MADAIPLKLSGGRLKQFSSSDRVPAENLSLPGAWGTSVPITITATTTNPTKATTTQNDFIRSRNWGSNIYEIDALYSASSSAGAANGSGNYLFTLPDSLLFNTTEHPLYTGALTKSIAPIYSVQRSVSGLVSSTFLGTVSLANCLVIPYTSSSFRLLAFSGDFANNYIGSSNYQLAQTDEAIAFNFRFIKQ